MKTKENTIIILESKEEKDLLAHIMYWFYEHSREGGVGGVWDEIYKVFQKVSGCQTIQEYQRKQMIELESLRKTEVPSENS